MSRTHSYIEEAAEPDKFIEVIIVYKDGDTETHLVLAANEVKAVGKLQRHWQPKGPVAGMKCEPCEKYTSVVIGHRTYGIR